MSENTSWLARLRGGLARTSSKLTEGVSALLTKRKLDAQVLEELEELLITADLGPAVAARLVADFGKERFGKDVTDSEVKEALAAQIGVLLAPYAQPLVVDAAHKPYVILMVGVNGSGKTTTIGKLASLYKAEGKSVMLAAGDTFRAAAIAQLKVWGDRAGVPVVTGPENGDAAALAYQALERAKKENVDVLLIDTAGRLHNKAGLMEELAKIVRVIKKLDETAPHATLLVLDATTGQNAHAQTETFKNLTNVTGLVVTKLDGTAKGGVIVALGDRFKLPVHAVGVGEGIEDLRAFDAQDFARALMGVEG